MIDDLVEIAGVVLPEDWTMKLLPENSTMSVGESVSFKIRVLDSTGNHLPGLWFTVFDAIEPEILRGPGLVSSTDSVTYTGVASGRTLITGYLGDHAVKTTLTVVDKTPGENSGPEVAVRR